MSCRINQPPMIARAAQNAAHQIAQPLMDASPFWPIVDGDTPEEEVGTEGMTGFRL